MIKIEIFPISIVLFLNFIYNHSKSGWMFMASKYKNNSFKYILCIIIFFIFGTIIGFIGTKYVLESKKESVVNEDSSGIVDITDTSEYQATIEKLHAFVKDSSIFYSTLGFNPQTVDNNFKLDYAFQIVMASKVYTTETINAISWDSEVCPYDFLVDILDTGQSTGGCTVYRILRDSINNAYSSTFSGSTLEITDFNSSDGKRCLLEESGYICGVVSREVSSGVLTPKFSVNKVLKDEDGTIKIYDRGYLEDTRSHVVNPDDGIDHYYLHSADSMDYYYELRSADNFTFVHEFKLDENRNYYYVQSYLEK